MSAAAGKMSLTQATMLVAGNMIGTGVFLLPVNLAQVGGIAIFGWVVATLGVAALGLIFAKLGELKPSAGGPYAYARDFLGPYAGFQTNYVYWFGNWIGNIAIAVAATGYLAELIPALSAPPLSVIATAGVIWLLTFANILGPRVIGALESWTMALALIPILAIATFGWYWFDTQTFLSGWNVSGGSDMHAISRAASMALWAYMGIESAAVSAGVIENPSRNVPLATLIGLALAAVIYVLSSSVIMGILPNETLRTSHAPFAEAARMALGTPGAVIISICAILKSVGSLGGWMLLVGQSAQAAANDGMFPRIFAKENSNGVPGSGLVIVSVLMTIVLFATISPSIGDQFNHIVNLAVILVIVPYIYSAVSVVKVIYDRGLPRRTFVTYKVLAIAAVIYCLWVILGGDPKTVVHALVALLISVPLYPFFIRSMEGAAQRSSQTQLHAAEAAAHSPTAIAGATT
ncbi:MAG: amino acid permease [Povalibacter sp.]